MVCDDGRKPEVARPAGFEPATSCSGGRRSIQLSYGRVVCACIRYGGAEKIWRARRDLNPRPTGSKPGALSS